MLKKDKLENKVTEELIVMWCYTATAATSCCASYTATSETGNPLSKYSWARWLVTVPSMGVLTGMSSQNTCADRYYLYRGCSAHDWSTFPFIALQTLSLSTAPTAQVTFRMKATYKN